MARKAASWIAKRDADLGQCPVKLVLVSALLHYTVEKKTFNNQILADISCLLELWIHYY